MTKVSKPFDIISFGANCIDYLITVPYYPQKDTKNKLKHLSYQPGGQAATASVLLSRYGLRVKYIGKAGDDSEGLLSINSLKKENIDISSVIHEDNTKTQKAFIIIDERTGERTIIYHRDKKLNMVKNDIDPSDIIKGRLLIIDDMDSNGALFCAETAKEHNIPIIIDMETADSNTKRLLSISDYIICSKDFLLEWTREEEPENAIMKLGKYTNAFICSTLGKNGAISLFKNRIIHTHPHKIKARDTTGCGDIFHGAFAYGLLQKWNLERILKFSNICAALKSQKIGGRPGIPDLDTVIKIMDS